MAWQPEFKDERPAWQQVRDGDRKPPPPPPPPTGLPPSPALLAAQTAQARDQAVTALCVALTRLANVIVEEITRA